MADPLLNAYRQATTVRAQAQPPGGGAESFYPKEYSTWAERKDPVAMGPLLEALAPVTASGISAYGGGQGDNPLLRSRARVLTAEAIHSYDPTSKAKLSSWVHSNLQGLRRYGGDIASPIKVPERIRMDSAALHRASNAHEEEFGLAPSEELLADQTGLSTKRIRQVRDYDTAKITGGQAAAAEGNPEGGRSFAVDQPDAWEDVWGQMFRNDLGETDKYIFDSRVHGGKPIGDIANKLGISAAAVSKRSKMMAGRYAEGLDLKGAI